MYAPKAIALQTENNWIGWKYFIKKAVHLLSVQQVHLGTAAKIDKIIISLIDAFIL